ncbi:methyltransferase-like protein 27 [Galendromus occidentalis]|uniref:Methyltransferase-like protein 27 n=1 Tax=Galendromus occidentalis TaxID=34638 RepID=A0AAJ6VYX6_9ACAR|nr:methyltransferase-like protein 27 [Galendromus occidentalis]
MHTLSYRAPEYVAALLRFDLEVEFDAKILDIGCGTGLVGKELTSLHYVNVHGVDIAPKMILLAQAKNCYRSCRLIEDLRCVRDTYDVVIMCSVFGRGHVSLESAGLVPDLIRDGARIIIAQLSPETDLENKELQNFAEAIATRLKAQAPRVEPIERYISERSGILAIVSVGTHNR